MHLNQFYNMPVDFTIEQYELPRCSREAPPFETPSQHQQPQQKVAGHLFVVSSSDLRELTLENDKSAKIINIYRQRDPCMESTGSENSQRVRLTAARLRHYSFVVLLSAF